MNGPFGFFDSDQHALRAGYLIGHLMGQGVEIRPTMQGRDYTPIMKITVPMDGYGMENIVIRVQVLPPEEEDS